MAKLTKVKNVIWYSEKEKLDEIREKIIAGDLSKFIIRHDIRDNDTPCLPIYAVFNDNTEIKMGYVPSSVIEITDIPDEYEIPKDDYEIAEIITNDLENGSQVDFPTITYSLPTELDEEIDYTTYVRGGNSRTLFEMLAPKTDYSFDKELSTTFLKEIAKRKYVVNISDYDADGVSSAFIMKKGLDHITGGKRPVFTKFNSRYTDGYNISISTLQDTIKTLEEKGIDKKDITFLFTDTGSSCMEQIEFLKKEGCGTIVVDHHRAENDKKSNPDLMINPFLDEKVNKQTNGNYWCGAGLSFGLLEKSIKDNNLHNELKLSAVIATIADKVPMLEGNLIYEREIFNEIRKDAAWLPEWFEGLTNDSGKKGVSNQNIGFSIAPRINAPGRLFEDGAKKFFMYMMNPDISFEFKKNGEGKPAKTTINSWNKTRKSLSDELLATSLEKVDRNKNIIVLTDKEALVGLGGIIAGKVAEQNGKPCGFGAVNSNGDYVFSFRTYGDIDIFKTFEEKGIDKLCSNFGGHSGALGLTVKKENLDKLIAEIEGITTLVKAVPTEELEDTNRIIPLNKVSDFSMINTVNYYGCNNLILFETPIELFYKYGEKHGYIVEIDNAVSEKMKNDKVASIVFSVDSINFKGEATVVVHQIITEKEKNNEKNEVDEER